MGWNGDFSLYLLLKSVFFRPARDVGDVGVGSCGASDVMFAADVFVGVGTSNFVVFLKAGGDIAGSSGEGKCT